MPITKMYSTLKGFDGWRTLSGLEPLLFDGPQGSRNENPGYANNKMYSTLKGFDVWRTLSGLERLLFDGPQGSRKLEPWAEISERLRRTQTEPALK